MYFWKRLFSRAYEQTLWKPALKPIFPNKRIDRSAVAVRLERIHQTRNRVAHHEPVYGHRLFDTLTVVDFLASNLGTAGSDGRTALHKMLRSEHAALENQAHVLRLRIETCAGAIHQCAQRGHLHSRASRNAHGEHRRTYADASPIKPRSRDPLRW
jgi:hypothetical protein